MEGGRGARRARAGRCAHPAHPPPVLPPPPQGGFQYWLYNVKFTQLCAPLTARFGHRGVAPVKVFLDQAIHHPLCYFPFFYGLKTFVEGKPLSTAVVKYKAEAWESCKALWKVSFLFRFFHTQNINTHELQI